MDATTINKVLVRKTLSSKKATPKSIRNVLTTPRPNFRPIVKDKNEAEIIELIKKLFGTPHSIPKIPWDEVREIVPKIKRKKLRENLLKEDVESTHSIRKTHKCFILGINEIIKKLEKDIITAVILDSDILEMTTVYNHILRLCQLKKSPIILMANLGNLLLSSVGIKSRTLGFTDQTNCGYFEPIVTKIKQLSSVQNTDSEKVVVPEKIVVKPMDLNVDIKIEPKKFYLFRDSNQVQVYTPQKPASEIQTNSDDFISFSEPNQQDQVKFIPMKMKKVVSNKARKNKNVKKTKI